MRVARGLARIKAFFSFAVGEGWVAKSPVGRLGPPKGNGPTTMPLSATEMRMMVMAAKSASPRDLAFMLLMRYSGLTIQDAATVGRDKLAGTLLTLRWGKSGELVQVNPPDPVVAASEGLPAEGRHYFWTGKSAPVTAAKHPRRRLLAVAANAKVENFPQPPLARHVRR